MFLTESENTKNASKELKETLRNRFKFESIRKHDAGADLFDKIEAYVNAKINDAVRQMDNKINKRGFYDPDY